MSTIHNKASITSTPSNSTSSSTSSTTVLATNSLSSTITGTATITSGNIYTGINSYPYTSDRVIRLQANEVDEQAFRLPWGKVDSISHEELIKYIGERDLRESNELVRTLWDRYQTAVKLIWSEDDEQEK